MADDKDQLVGEDAMDKMSVAPPDPAPDASGPYGASVSNSQAAASEGVSERGIRTEQELSDESGVADEDPLSAHPT